MENHNKERIIHFDDMLVEESQFYAISSFTKRFSKHLKEYITFESDLNGEVILLHIELRIYNHDIEANMLKLLSKLRNLRHLVIKAPLKEIPDLSNLKSLTSLKIWGLLTEGNLKINDMPEKLEEASFLGKYFDNIVFLKHCNIKKIAIYSKNIKKIDASLFLLPELESMSLNRNMIENIDIDLNRLEKLKLVTLIDTKIKDTISISKKYPNIKFVF